MQSKAEWLKHIDSIEFRTTSNAEFKLNCNIASASQYNDCLGTRSKASSSLLIASFFTPSKLNLVLSARF